MGTKAYKKATLKKSANQRTKTDDREVKNSAGGFVFGVDDFARLQRFLIIGAEGGTYYIRESKLVADNVKCVKTCLKADYKKTIDTIAEISASGRAVKNDPAVLALALAASDSREEVRKYALSKLDLVCRIPTHLFHFAAFIDELRGWGSGLKRAVASWYNDKEPQRVAFNAVKYQSRDGWSNRDLLRLAHPKPKNPIYGMIYKYIIDGTYTEEFDNPTLGAIYGFEKAKNEKDAKKLIKLIQDYKLTWEMLPTHALNDKAVWEALLENLAPEAVMRNLAKMTSIGLIANGAAATRKVVQILSDVDRMAKAKVHPIKILSALKVYSMGRGFKGNLTWEPVGGVVDALDKAFYNAFPNVPQITEPIILGLDVSGSMSSFINSDSPLRACDVTAAMSLITAARADEYVILGYAAQTKHLPITPRMRLDQVLRLVENQNFGGTDCAIPFLWAVQNKYPVSSVVSYTDSETWAGTVKVPVAIKKCRDFTGKNTTSVVVATTSTGFSINDPNDPYALDIAGFDSSVPQVIAEFTK